MTHEQHVEKQLPDYEVATSNNRRLTDRKYSNFDLCVLLTALSLLLLLTVPFANEIFTLIGIR